MLTLDEGLKSVQFARHVAESYVKNKEIPSFDLGEIFNQELGVFVTIHTYPGHDLRGCIGIPQPIMPLKEAIIESAKSATRDPRFPPLDESELDDIIIEVTILTKPELIEVSQPEEYLSNIEISRDGLIVEQGFYKGLLLPQVPIEQGWDKEEFLSHTCMKAGLSPDAWFDENTKIYKFSGQIFTEVEPRRKIREKNLDGSDN
jgi:uncharacterized protein (TIGR00296 family)